VLDNAQARLSASQAAAVSDQLSSAATLNPDRQVAVLRARLALLQGDRAGSTQILKGVVAHEPENISAWIALAVSDPSPAELRLAIGKVAQLDPKLARARR
jgi:hypothetical protein